MDPVKVLVFLAALATLVSLASGIASMATDSAVGHTDSGHWMNWRVAFQGLTFLMIVLFASS